MANFEHRQHWFRGFEDTLQLIQNDADWKIDPSKKLITLEIGVYEGMSSVAILDTFCHNPESLHIAIDPFTGSSEHLKAPQHFPELNNLETRARRNIACAENGKKCRVIPQKSEEAKAILEDEFGTEPFIDFLYIDGAHEEEFVEKDIENYVPWVKTGGLVCFDDYGWPGVKAAVDKNLAVACEFVRRDKPVGQFLARKIG